MNQNNQQIGTNSVYQQFTADEIRILRECNRESFYSRSLPLSSVFSIATYYAIKNGYLKASARYGVAPKVILAAIAGYFVGKFSYRNICAEKIMTLQNSPLAEMLRKRKNREIVKEASPFIDESNLNSSIVSDNFHNYSEKGPRSLEMDTLLPLRDDEPHFQLPDLQDYTYENPKEENKKVKGTTTYDELRRKNREEYEAKRFSAPIPPPPPIPPRVDTREKNDENNPSDESWYR